MGRDAAVIGVTVDDWLFDELARFGADLEDLEPEAGEDRDRHYRSVARRLVPSRLGGRSDSAGVVQAHERLRSVRLAFRFHPAEVGVERQCVAVVDRTLELRRARQGGERSLKQGSAHATAAPVGTDVEKVHERVRPPQRQEADDRPPSSLAAATRTSSPAVALANESRVQAPGQPGKISSWQAL
jgi:hypothetical protein